MVPRALPAITILGGSQGVTVFYVVAPLEVFQLVVRALLFSMVSVGTRVCWVVATAVAMKFYLQCYCFSEVKSYC